MYLGEAKTSRRTNVPVSKPRHFHTHKGVETKRSARGFRKDLCCLGTPKNMLMSSLHSKKVFVEIALPNIGTLLDGRSLFLTISPRQRACCRTEVFTGYLYNMQHSIISFTRPLSMTKYRLFWSSPWFALWALNEELLGSAPGRINLGSAFKIHPSLSVLGRYRYPGTPE